MCLYISRAHPRPFVVIVQYRSGLGTASTFTAEQKAWTKSEGLSHMSFVSGVGTEAFMATTTSVGVLIARVGTTIFQINVPVASSGPRLVAFSRAVARAL